MRLIDADALKKHLDYVCVGGGKWGDAEKAFINAFKDFVDGEITIEPQRWIPCSERLPEDKQRVIIQMYNGYMEIIEFSAIGLTDHILAWMPFPEPYKEENK